MARPWRVRFAGAKYHLTGRGNGRAALFLAPHDYARFMEQLDAALDADGLMWYAYEPMQARWRWSGVAPERRIPMQGSRIPGPWKRGGGRESAKEGACGSDPETKDVTLMVKLARRGPFALRLSRRSLVLRGKGFLTEC
ncbi:MAG: hypothetical protein PHR35_17715 [Kiritimatiellae bacterium]|nr:hypothetical protein [Kiritimatiellia bacterium]